MNFVADRLKVAQLLEGKARQIHIYKLLFTRFPPVQQVFKFNQISPARYVPLTIFHKQFRQLAILSSD